MIYSSVKAKVKTWLGVGFRHVFVAFLENLNFMNCTIVALKPKIYTKYRNILTVWADLVVFGSYLLIVCFIHTTFLGQNKLKIYDWL